MERVFPLLSNRAIEQLTHLFRLGVALHSRAVGWREGERERGSGGAGKAMPEYART